MSNIPKIIHHISPKDKSKWHPLWIRCYDSWKKNFKESEYMLKMWNDEDDLDNLVENFFPTYFDFYSKLPYHICKIDFAKFCILYKYGGIYSDMDVFCYKNFYNKLNKKIKIGVLESVNSDELVVNSLIISEKENDFFIDCMEVSKNQHIFLNDNFENDHPMHQMKNYARIVCGPHSLSKSFLNHKKNKITMLEKELYNPDLYDYNSNIYTKHMLTSMWGKESRLFLEKNNISFKDCYYDKHHIDYEKFDFFKTHYKSFTYF